MKFTIEYATFMDMLKQVGKKPAHMKRADKGLRISACTSRVFVESNEMTIGVDATVSEDGQCLLDRKSFVAVLKTFKGKDPLPIEVNEGRLAIDSFSMPVKEWSAHAEIPENFVPGGPKA